MFGILLLIILLVQVEPFVTLRPCYIDLTASPWEFRPDPQSDPFEIRPSAVIAVAPPPRNIAGIKCSLVIGPTGRRYVIGTVPQVKAILEGRAE